MIDTEALRKKVIDLAIQGKLTEQLPSDGDAETLYAQILDQKLQLIKEGKIKKDKALPDIAAEEIPFEVPDNWKWVRLYEISDTNIGLTYHPENIVDEGTVVLRSNNIKNGAFDYSDLVRVNCEVRENQYIRKNDILICSRNGSKNLVGKCAIYDGELGDVSFGAFMAILRTSLFKYIYFYLTTDAFRRYFSDDDTKQINQVTQDILKKAIVPLPPLAEQERIVAKLERVLSEIDIIDDLQAKYSNDLAVLKGKIIDAGIQGKLTEQLPEDGDAEDLYAQIQNQKSQLIKEGRIKKEKPLPDIAADEIPFEIPKNWKWVRLGELIKINSGTGLTSYQMGKGDIPVYGGNGVTGYHDESLVNEETIVIGRVGFYCGSVHVTPEKAWVTDNAFITQYPKNLINRDFLVYALRNMNLGQNTNGAAQPVVSGKKIYPLLFALPPFDEQKRIAKRIDDVLTIVDSLQ
ncbi:type I restriction enzyme, S subunit [Lachnospiraceae bacterium YSD2013]|nr:type I restriction enzyme, S subunit [Lachnospiraceae bacterium YSD2013]